MYTQSKSVGILLGVLTVVFALSGSTLCAQQTVDAAGESSSSFSPWRGGMRFSGAIGVPFGEFYHDLTWGPGAGIELIIPATAHTSIRLGVSRVGIDDNADSILARSLLTRRLIEDNLSARIWKVSAAAEYRNWSETNPTGGPMYFVFSGLGIMNHSLEGEYVLLDEATQGLFRVVASDESETRIVLLAGAGGMLKLGGNVGWDVTGEINLLARNNENRNGAFYSRIDMSSIVEFKTGLVVMF